LHELARNAGLDLPTYLGEMQKAAEKDGPNVPAPRQTNVVKDGNGSA
jgi:hypothetical protein